MDSLAQQLTKVCALVFVLTTMLGLGMQSRFATLLAPLRDTWQTVSALLAVFVLVPGLAWLIISCLHPDPAIAAALLVLATVPGSPTLIKFAAVAKGDQALAASLVVLLMLGSVLYQPVVLPWLVHGVVVRPADIVATLLSTVLLPLLAGLALRARRPVLAARVQPWMRRGSSASAGVLLLLLPLANIATLKAFAGTGGIGAAIVFIAGALAVGWLLGARRPAARPVHAMCCAQGNYAVAFVVAARNFPDPRVALMLLVLLLVALAILIPFAAAFGSAGQHASLEQP